MSHVGHAGSVKLAPPLQMITRQVQKPTLVTACPIKSSNFVRDPSQQAHMQIEYIQLHVPSSSIVPQAHPNAICPQCSLGSFTLLRPQQKSLNVF